MPEIYHIEKKSTPGWTMCGLSRKWGSAFFMVSLADYIKRRLEGRLFVDGRVCMNCRGSAARDLAAALLKEKKRPPRNEPLGGLLT